MGGGVFDAVTGLVSEFAEIHFVVVGRGGQHADVGAGAKYSVLGRGKDNGGHFGMLKAQALYGIIEFDVNAQVVGVQF